MSTYVMSDIHGCYDELMQMLELISFSEEDRLIIAGDYVDRGPKSYEVLKWIATDPENVLFLRGNHDEEFAYCVDLMQVMFERQDMSSESNDGDVYRSYDEEMNCVFYDIDCGCAYREKCKTAKLACIRLEDEKIFYV